MIDVVDVGVTAHERRRHSYIIVLLGLWIFATKFLHGWGPCTFEFLVDWRDVWGDCGPVADKSVVVGPLEDPGSLIFNAGFHWSRVTHVIFM